MSTALFISDTFSGVNSSSSGKLGVLKSGQIHINLIDRPYRRAPESWTCLFDGRWKNMLEGLLNLYRQLGGVGSFINLLIIVIFIAASYANILVRRKYLNLSEELTGYCSGELKSFSSEMLQWITDEYREAVRNGLSGINTLSIINTGIEVCLKTCVLAERLLKKTNGLLITTGLFGTFTGLTYAVGRMGQIMADTSAETLMSETGADVLAILVSSFQGMAVAFVTSLLGTGFSIIFMIMSSFFSAAGAKELLVTQLEEYLDIRIASEIMEERRLNEKKNEELFSKTAHSMAEAVSSFKDVAAGFSDSLAAMKDFNADLTANMDRIRDSAGFLGNCLDRTSETVYECGVRIHKCAEALEAITSEIRASNQRLECMSSLISQLRTSLEDTCKDRETFLRTVNEIPDRLLNYHEAAVARVDRKQVGS